MQGTTTGGVRTVLRAEGLFVLCASLLAYSKTDLGWMQFALYFFAPDIALLAYLKGKRFGAACYNLTHSYIGALCLLSIGFYTDQVE